MLNFIFIDLQTVQDIQDYASLIFLAHIVHLINIYTYDIYIYIYIFLHETECALTQAAEHLEGRPAFQHTTSKQRLDVSYEIFW